MNKHLCYSASKLRRQTKKDIPEERRLHRTREKGKGDVKNRKRDKIKQKEENEKKI